MKTATRKSVRREIPEHLASNTSEAKSDMAELGWSTWERISRDSIDWIARGMVLAAAGVAAVIHSEAVLPEAKSLGWGIGVLLLLAAIILPPVFAGRQAYESVPKEIKGAKWRQMIYVLLLTVPIQFAVLATAHSVIKSSVPEQTSADTSK
jgi:hypothetical protein